MNSYRSTHVVEQIAVSPRNPAHLWKRISSLRSNVPQTT
jgi:hypothetical protein